MSVCNVRLTSKVMIKNFSFIMVGFSNSGCSKNGIDVCFEEERKRLDDILCHNLALISLLLRFFATFSMCSCLALRMNAVCLKIRCLCLICILMFELVNGGSFGLTVISLYGTDCFAASVIVLETLSAISSILLVADIKLKSFLRRSCLYLL